MGIRESMHEALRAAGIAVHLPGQREEGPGDEGYVVISDGGVMATGKTTGRKSFLVTGYVQAKRQLDLRPLLAKVTAALAPLQGIRTNGEVSPEDFDEKRGAVFSAIEYTALCAI